MAMISKETKPDLNASKVAAAPPPPPSVAIAMSSGDNAGGFNPTGQGLAIEMIVGIGAVLALGAAVIFAGGAIAAWATPLIPISVDQSIGESSQEQMSSSSKECTNPAAQKYVEDLAAPLIEAAGDVPFSFSFRVVDTPEVNAYALPGGFVTVNR